LSKAESRFSVIRSTPGSSSACCWGEWDSSRFLFQNWVAWAKIA